MITIEQKLQKIFSEHKEYLEDEIRLLEMLLKGNQKQDEIEATYNKTKKDYEYFLKDEKRNNVYGWDYFRDVLYLDEEQCKNFNEVMKKDFDGKYDLKEYPKKRILLIHINKLIYYNNEIEHLELTQKNVKRNRIVEPLKEVLTILRYIGDNNEATEPLVKLLSKMEGNYSDKLSSRQRDFYHSYIEEKTLSTPPLNKDKLKRLKEDYQNEISKLEATIKNHKKNYYNEVVASILAVLQLPTKQQTRASK